jgi:hypothetical protein
VSKSVVKRSVVKWSEVLVNRVSIVIRRYTDHTRFAVYFIFFVSILYHCINSCVLCLLLFNYVNYVFSCYVYIRLLLCMFRSWYSVSLCCSMY